MTRPFERPGFFVPTRPLTNGPRPALLSCMKEIAKYPGCFVCGERNEHGLKARFYFDGEKAVSELTAGAAFEGYAGIYHGGVTASMLDEIMIKAILAGEIYVVTVEMTVRYHKAVRVGDRLTFTGWISGRKGRVFFTEGQAVGSDGSVYATATGKYVEAKPALREELLKSLE